MFLKLIQINIMIQWFSDLTSNGYILFQDLNMFEPTLKLIS